MAATPGHTGSTSVTGDAQAANAHPNQPAPPATLPADSLLLAREAAVALGWRGTILPEIRALGRKVHFAVELRPDVHAERIATGVEPVIDRASVATWTWPELADTAPAPAVEITGVLSVTRHWRTGLAWTVPFARYYEAAMVLPSNALLTHDYVDNCLPRARAYGLSIVAAHEDEQVERDLTASAGVPMIEQDPVERWLNELAYEQLLATAEVPANAG